MTGPTYRIVGIFRGLTISQISPVLYSRLHVHCMSGIFFMSGIFYIPGTYTISYLYTVHSLPHSLTPSLPPSLSPSLPQQRLQDLQQHVQTTRERTVRMLAEKDAELQRLRSVVEGALTDNLGPSRSQTSVSGQSSAECDGEGEG